MLDSGKRLQFRLKSFELREECISALPVCRQAQAGADRSWAYNIVDSSVY